MTTAARSWVGRELAGGRYRVTAQLGEGGMGFVYRARDANLDADVVIKVPRASLLADPEFVSRFGREVRALVRLSHPHVVKITDVGQEDGVPFAVMQFLPGGSLEQRQQGPTGRRVALAPHTLAGWLEPVAEALDYIHEQGYVHRDVKPANILFDDHGNAYLGDFGVAKAVAARTLAGHSASLTGTGMVLGTPCYMAPEMMLGHGYDGRIDQYALAVTTYELLGGRLPFDGPTPGAILLKQTTEPPPPLRQLVPALPEALSAAVQRALAKDPAQRFADCLAFARAVLRAVPKAPTASRPAPRPGAPGADAPGKVSCPHCGTSYTLPARAQGKRLRCPQCQQVFQPPRATPGAVRRPAVRETAREVQARLDTRPAPAAGWQEEAELPPDAAPRQPRRVRALVVAGVMAPVAAAALAGWMLRPASPPQGARTDGAARNVPSPAAALQLAPIEDVTLTAGGTSKVLTVAVRRPGGERRPVQVQVAGLPDRVTAEPKTLTLAAAEDSARLTLSAAADAERAEGTVKLMAGAGDRPARGETTFRLTVQLPVLRLPRPPDTALDPGKGKSVPLRVDRGGYVGPVELQVQGLPDGVMAGPAHVAAGEDQAELSLTVAADAPAAETEAVVRALVGGHLRGDPVPFRITVRKPDRSADVARFLEQGDRSLRQGDYDRALADYGGALDLDPGSAPAHARRGLTYFQKRDYGRALDECGKALERDADLPLAHAVRGGVCSVRCEYEEALAELDRALRLDPKLALAHALRANTVGGLRNDDDESLEGCRRALELDPDLALAYVVRAGAYIDKRVFDQGIRDCGKALELDRNLALAYATRAQGYVQKGDPARALEDASRALQIDPSCEPAHGSQGDAYAKRKDYPSAIECYNRALRLAPKDDSAHFSLAQVHAARHDTTRALEECKAGLAIRATPLGHTVTALVFQEMKDYEAALQHCTAAIQTNPNYPYAHDRLGSVHLAMGLYDQAIQDFSATIRLDPTAAGAFYQRGQAYQAKGEREQAERDFRKARDLDPSLSASPR
jgi:serine/threonine-protein kinase